VLELLALQEGLGPLDLQLLGLAVQLGQDLARLHRVPLLHEHLEEVAGHLGRDLGLAERQHLAFMDAGPQGPAGEDEEEDS